MLTPTSLRIVATMFGGVAQISTAFRLAYRFRTRRQWWDDAWAAFALACTFIQMVAIWIRTDYGGLGPLDQPHQARVVAYWLLVTSFTQLLWAARMSVLFSIIRITPPMMTLRRVEYFCAGFFGVMWAALTIQKVYVCGHDKSWEQKYVPQCHLGKSVGIVELTTDFVSDTILVVLPIHLLWGVGMPRQQRRLLFVIFSAAILTTLVSIVHAAYLLGPSGLYEAVTASCEGSVSLIVANLAVVLTFVARRVGIATDDEYSTNTAPSTGYGLRIFTKKAAKPQVTTLRFASETQATEGTDEVPGEAPAKGYKDLDHDVERDGKDLDKDRLDDVASFNAQETAKPSHSF